MNDSPAIYTFYFQKELGKDEFRRAAVSISRPGDNAGFDKENIATLAREFADLGWRISDRDTVQTISPVILNEWAPKPWIQNSGIQELVPKGRMMLYECFSGRELDSFYSEYRLQADRRDCARHAP